MILSKPHVRMQQAAMEKSVNVLSPEINFTEKADALHCDGRQYLQSRYWRDFVSFSGVLGSGMLQDGCRVNLGELKSSYCVSNEYVQTSQIRQEWTKDFSAVGSVRSTPSTGKLCTWGRGRSEEANGSALGFPITPRVA